MKRMFRRTAVAAYTIVAFPLLFVFFVCLAIISRAARRPIDVGLGPQPLINNVFHKRALEKAGHRAETFVTHFYYITEDFDMTCKGWPVRLASPWMAMIALFRYKILYIYFHGGPLAWTPLRGVEPWIFKLAGIKVLVMPYGADVQDLTHCPHYPFKHVMNVDYPDFMRQQTKISSRITRWTRHADHIISGCDWVDYTPRWDTLCLAHFSIDTDECLGLEAGGPPQGPVTVLHAPNHEAIKGTRFFESAVSELRDEGYDVELKILRKVPNHELRKAIAEAHIIADQLVVGWYAMFALEGMCAGKPVLCHLREDLVRLYEFAGLVEPGEIPLVNCDRTTVTDRLRELLDDPTRIDKVGRASREYVVRHHSLEAVGDMFAQANKVMFGR